MLTPQPLNTHSHAGLQRSYFWPLPLNFWKPSGHTTNQTILRQPHILYLLHSQSSQQYHLHDPQKSLLSVLRQGMWASIGDVVLTWYMAKLVVTNRHSRGRWSWGETMCSKSRPFYAIGRVSVETLNFWKPSGHTTNQSILRQPQILYLHSHSSQSRDVIHMIPKIASFGSTQGMWASIWLGAWQNLWLRIDTREKIKLRWNDVLKVQTILCNWEGMCENFEENENLRFWPWNEKLLWFAFASQSRQS